jgi:hypothetical protein
VLVATLPAASVLAGLAVLAVGLLATRDPAAPTSGFWLDYDIMEFIS